MQSHTLKRKTAQKRSQQVGRGGTRGKTSGRGHKGQKARAGHSIRPAIRDVIKRIPKLRGESASGKNHKGTKPQTVQLSELAAAFPKGGDVTSQVLVEKKLVRARGRKTPAVKILADGDVSVALNISGCAASASAVKAITDAGGSVSS